jgi:PAS domain S-box-containing protein
VTRRKAPQGKPIPADLDTTSADPLDHPLETLRTAIGTSADPTYSVNRDYRYTSFNAAHAAAMTVLYGIGIELGDSIVAAGSAADGAQTQVSLDRALSDEAFVEVAEAGAQADDPDALEVTYTPIHDVYDSVVGVLVQTRGLSDLARAQSALAESEARYRSYVTNAPYGVFVTDAQGGYVDVNPAAVEQTGYSLSELEQMSISELLAPESLVSGRQEFEHLVLTGASSGSLVLVRKDGTTFPVRLDAVRLSATRYLGFIVDVSEQQRAEDEVLTGAQQLMQTLKATIAALGAVTELRDPYTAGHQRRVAQLAGAIAAELGWSDERITSLRTAGQLHDIGKVVVPAEILSKPGRLTEVEMELVRGHAAASAALIAGIDFGGPVAAVVNQHHERLDGTGYPAGLVGAQILPEARVLAVADCVEAMASHRPYRPALGIDAALDEVGAGAGIGYDADVVAACVRLFRERGFTLAE